MGSVNISNIPEQQDAIDTYEQEVLSAIDWAVTQGFLSPDDKGFYQEIMDNKNILNKSPEVIELWKNINFIIENWLWNQLKDQVANKDTVVNINTWGDYYLEPIADNIVRTYIESKWQETNVYLHSIRRNEESDSEELPNMDDLD